MNINLTGINSIHHDKLNIFISSMIEETLSFYKDIVITEVFFSTEEPDLGGKMIYKEGLFSIQLDYRLYKEGILEGQDLIKQRNVLMHELIHCRNYFLINKYLDEGNASILFKNSIYESFKLWDEYTAMRESLQRYFYSGILDELDDIRLFSSLSQFNKQNINSSNILNVIYSVSHFIAFIDVYEFHSVDPARINKEVVLSNKVEKQLWNLLWIELRESLSYPEIDRLVRIQSLINRLFK